MLVGFIKLLEIDIKQGASMIKEFNSKRAFVKKLVAAVGYIAAADYTKTLISARADSIKEAANNGANDDNLQRKTLLQKQLVLMTDNEKKQMLDEIVNGYNKNNA